MRYLVDTDWIIDGISNAPGVLATLDRLSSEGVAVSIITLGEVFEGAHLSPDPQAELAVYRQFLAGYVVLPLTDSIMERFASIRALLRRQGNLIPDLDLLIAATALTENLSLLTRNARHFERIPDLLLSALG